MDTMYTSRIHGFLNSSHSILGGNLTQEGVISLLIVLGSSLSLVALVFAFITYSLFSDLRNLSGTALMNLLSSLFMTQLLYVIGVGEIMDSSLCMVLASALHFVRLCVFSWTLLLTHDMYVQYKTGTLVPDTDSSIRKHFIRCSLLGWGIPSMLLLTSLLIQYCDKKQISMDVSNLRKKICWFLDEKAFIYGLVLPSYFMVGVTFYYLLRTALLSRYIIGMNSDERKREKIKRKTNVQIVFLSKINVVSSIYLALATLSKLMNSEGIWISFHIFQALQGILMTMLVTCNRQILKLYTRSLKSTTKKHNMAMPSYIDRPSSSGLNKSTSLQMLTWDPPPDFV
ncbi:putative adhesion G protein-coupled receptor E4P [Euwallacea similis]|uniref:putative adhesion G protein-coupled receptor E4P n=1 Tax=Euwallacea similis TaxID=1736056 RepID=UPI00344D8878